MTNEQRVKSLFAEANPIPDADLFDLDEIGGTAYLATLEQRSSEMTQLDTKHAKDDTKRRPVGVWIALAATVILILGLGVVLFNQNQPDVAPASQLSPEETSMATASGFLEALWAFDVEDVTSYLADDADLSALGFGGEDWQFILRLQEAQKYQRQIGTCALTSSSPVRRTVECTYTFDALGSDELGLGPYAGSWIEVVVRDGEIRGAGESSHIEFTRAFSPQMWEPFGTWITDTYPDDVAVMYNNDFQTAPTKTSHIGRERLSEESIALWAERVTEYIAINTD